MPSEALALEGRDVRLRKLATDGTAIQCPPERSEREGCPPSSWRRRARISGEGEGYGWQATVFD